MSEYCVYLKMPSYLRQWFIHRHGGNNPVQLIQGSIESKVLQRVLNHNFIVLWQPLKILFMITGYLILLHFEPLTGFLVYMQQKDSSRSGYFGNLVSKILGAVSKMVSKNHSK